MRQHLVRRLDETFEPRAVADAGDAREIRPDAVALTERVASGALGLEQVAAGLESRNRPGALVALCRHGRRVLPAEEKIADGGGKKARIIDGGIQHPLSGRLVPDHQARKVTVRVYGVGARIQSELLLNGRDILALAGEEQPTGLGVELFRVLAEHYRRIPFGIDADSVEDDGDAHATGRGPLHLRELRRLERTPISAPRVNDVDDDRLPLEEIV